MSLALLTAYPVGLVLIWKKPGLRRLTRVIYSVACLPFFAAELLIASHGFWDFGGGMTLSEFSLDLDRGFWHDRRLERHRAAQREAGPGDPSSAAGELASLSWSGFRGPNRDGVVRDAGISLDWKNDPPRELYRQPVGGGYAGFVVGGGRTYTLEQRRDREAVACYDLGSGRELWAYEYKALFEETLGGNGPRSTPTLHDGHVFALGATGHLHCLRADTGERVWARNILTEYGATNLQWGLAASPLVFDGKVVVTGSGQGGASMLALDAATGRELWRADAGVQGYSSPVLATIAGTRQILNLAAQALQSVDPDTGKIAWRFPWVTDYGINVSQPLPAGDDRVFVSSGYGHGCALIRITRKDGAFEVTELWSNLRMKNKFTSSVIHDGFVYGLDERDLACLDLATGERRWKGGGYDYGSVLLVDDHLLVLAEDGRLALVRATPDEFAEVGSLQVLEGRTWNHFTVVGGRLLARNHKEMVCYDLRAGDRS